MNDQTQAVTRKATKRMQIVLAAFKLFTENGFYATGVDWIMREAKVSKRTMYIYFPTKNDLIAAVLAHYHSDYERKLSTLLAREDLDSREKIVAIFEDAGLWFADEHFHGCLAINAMGEFDGKDPAIENACRVFKTWELGVFQELTKDFPVKCPEDLAFKLLILIEGLGAIAQVMKQPCPVDIKQMVINLIDCHSIV